MLREVGITDKKRLIDFIEKNIEHFTREGLKYAIEKLSSAEQKRMLSLIGKPKLQEVEDEIGEAPKKKRNTGKGKKKALEN